MSKGLIGSFIYDGIFFRTPSWRGQHLKVAIEEWRPHVYFHAATEIDDGVSIPVTDLVTDEHVEAKGPAITMLREMARSIGFR